MLAPADSWGTLSYAANNVQSHRHVGRPTGRASHVSMGTALSLILLPVNNQFPQNDYRLTVTRSHTGRLSSIQSMPVLRVLRTAAGLLCTAVSSGVGGESSSQYGCYECQIVVHQAGTVVWC